MTRWPIRVRLTAAFAAAMLLMLTGAALFVYVRLRADLDDAVDARLRARAAAIFARPAAPLLAGVALEDPEESFVQVLDLGGQILESTGNVRGSALTSGQARGAASGGVLLEHAVRGIDGRARMLARPLARQTGTAVVVVGQSLLDRNEALASVVRSFVGGGLLAVLLASMTGYLLGRAGLAPVEAMRRRAMEVSLSQAGAGLPLPVARDEVRRLGETLNDMIDRLRSSFERERRFVADASHELRTPVAVVKTELEGALRTNDYGPQVRESLLAALEECDRIAQLADDLLVLARLDAEGLPVRCELLRPQALLEGVRARFVDRADQRDRRIRIEVAADQPFEADQERLRQALANLVDNALRHGTGDVVLHCRRIAGGTQLDVRDHGPGFAPDIAERAFERFAQGDATRTSGGAGLGLAIVQTVAQSHGGRAMVVPGDGATVRIWLPDRLTP